MYIAEEGIPIVLKKKKKSQNVEPCIIVFEKKKENVHGSSDTFP